MSGTKYLILLIATIFALIFPLLNGATLEKRPVFVFLNNPDDVSGPGGDGAASQPDVNSSPVVPEGATAAAPAAASPPEPSATPATPAFLATPVMSTASSLITAPPPPVSAGCVPWPQCNLFYQYVNVYYWPEDSQNTACLSADPHITPSPPDIPNVQSPSVYIIFPSIRGYNGCSQIGTTFADLTTSFAPGALSTIGLDSSTYSFNFGDLPCPPADVGWDPSKGPYTPLLAPPDFLFHLDPAFATCIPGTSQGIDPYTTLTPATTDSGAEGVGCGIHCERAKRALEHAHPVPWAPQRTAEPTS